MNINWEIVNFYFRGEEENKIKEPFSREHGWDRGTPLDRYYIEKFLNKHKINITGDVAEIGEDKYTKKYGVNVDNSYILSAYKGTSDTILCDLEDASTIPLNKFDCFILTQVLNVVFDLKSAVRNIWYSLKCGGCVLVTVPFINPLSIWDDSQWGEYWRFTERSLYKLFINCGFKIEEIFSFGNYSIAQMFLKGIVLEDKIIPEVDKHYLSMNINSTETCNTIIRNVDYSKKIKENIIRQDKQFAIVIGGVFRK